MRHLRYVVPAVVVALAAAWAIWPRALRLDMRSDALALLRRMPHVAAFEATCPRNPLRRVVHVLDYYDLPDDLAIADGHDPAELARKVGRVQQQQAMNSSDPGEGGGHGTLLAGRGIDTHRVVIARQGAAREGE